MRIYQKPSIAKAFERTAPRPIIELPREQVDKLKNYSDILLGILMVGGILTMTVLAPNALQALELFEKRGEKRNLTHKEKRRKVLKSFYYLKNQGDVKFIPKGDDFEVILTQKGKKKIKRLNFETLSIQRDKQWDGKFWQVAADIPTKYKLGADAFRDKLKLMNFYSLQRTLWFYPFNPRIEIEFVARTYGIDPFVTVMKIDELDISDKKLLVGYFKKAGG